MLGLWDEDKYTRKTKAMVIGRKPNKIDMRIKDESVEQVDSFKYLGYNISGNLNCWREVKQRILDDGQHHDKWTVCRYEKEG